MPHTIPTLASEVRLPVMRLARRLRQQRADHGLSFGAVSVLATLDRRGPLTPGELAASEGVRPPSMTRTLACLADAGYVTRTTDPEDRRSSVVSLTASARELLREDRRRRDEWMADRLAALAPADRLALQRALPILEELASS